VVKERMSIKGEFKISRKSHVLSQVIIGLEQSLILFRRSRGRGLSRTTKSAHGSEQARVTTLCARL